MRPCWLLTRRRASPSLWSAAAGPSSLGLGVAGGAAPYGGLKPTGGRRIGGGTARSYYVGVEAQKAQPSQRAGLTVLCVLPRHIEENEEIAVPGPPLELALGEPVL